MKYTRDGGVIPNGLPTSDRGSRDHYKQFGLYKGQVVEIIYPEDERNLNGERIEYVVKINGQEYPNAVDVRESGAIYNYQEKIYKPVEYSYTGKIDKSTYDEEMDGEFVYVLFLLGNGDIPIIIGGAEHPRHAEYKKAKAEDGIRSIKEFNGLEFEIDKDSNFTITHVGRKDPETGELLNPESEKCYYKMYGNGDVELNVWGKNGATTDLRMMFTKETKRFEVHAQDNSIYMEASGIRIKDKFNNITEMKSDQILIKEASGGRVKLSGSKVGIGADSAETLTEISNSLQTLITMIASMQTETHIGNLGYSTSPPENEGDYATAEGELTSIKGLVDGIKGGV